MKRLVPASQADLQPWMDWYDDFVIKGNTGADKETAITVEYLEQKVHMA